VMNKITPVWGDISCVNLGLTDEHLTKVLENVEIIFHLAASLKLEATLKPNILTNLTATKNVLDVAKRMKRLVQMVHTSTAFCNVEQKVMEEKIYDFPHRPEDLIQCAEWMSEEAMAEAQKVILGTQPNTYTYTKRLAEILVRDEYNKGSLPVCIVRPSIVSPSWVEPVPGWVDSLNGPPGILMAGGKGALRCLMLDVNSHFEAIPCDAAINGLITIVKHLATQPKRFVGVNNVAT
jgi:alcohol-forming fatty acyl-CoA reductase